MRNDPPNEAAARLRAMRAVELRNAALVKVIFAFAALLIIALVVFGGVAGCGAYKGWARGQARANAHNKVSITAIEIQNQDQQAKVVAAQNGIVKAKANQRYLEAVGIRKAQDEISKTLTPLYIQHEAIQAQQADASKPNATVVYVPSGPQGVPLVSQGTKP